MFRRDTILPILTLLLAFLLIVCVGLGLFFYDSQLCSVCERGSFEHFSNIVYETAQVFLLNTSARPGQGGGFFRMARVLAVLLFALLSYQFLLTFFSHSFTNLRLCRWWITGGGQHIVCGLGRVGWPLVKHLRDQRKRVIVIERDNSNELIDDARRLGAIVLIGDATEDELYHQIFVYKADAVYLVTGSDAENIESLMDIAKVLKPKASRAKHLKCHIHLLDPSVEHILANKMKLVNMPALAQPFSVSRNSARQLLVEKLTDIRPKVDQVALYVLFGFGTTGRILAQHLAELTHFENFKRARLLILCEDPVRAASDFLASHGQFSPEQIHENWGSIKFDAEADDWSSKKYSPKDSAYRNINSVAIEYACNAIFATLPSSMADRTFLWNLRDLVNADKVSPALLFCAEEDDVNFTRSVQLQHFFSTECGNHKTPFYVWIPRQDPLAEILQSQKPQLQSFGSCNEELTLDKVQKPIEDVLGLEIQAGFDRVDTTTRKGREEATEKWSKSSQVILHSNRMAAIHFLIKMRCCGYEVVPKQDSETFVFELDEAAFTTLAKMEHNRWIAERLLAGWSHGVGSGTTPRRLQLCTWEVLESDENLKKEPLKDYDQIRTVVNRLKENGYGLRKLKKPEDNTPQGT